nr:uncharacterized mitochondrial protein AtMg00810-like [Tanacetum cinerariifolium]GEV75391.1 uncharacterized mitochondrial protein AtMg00810-like [Tanacetum cinerariifolium]
MPELEDISTFNFSNKDEDDGAEADMNNLDIAIQVNPTLTMRIHKYHHLDQVIDDLHSATQTRNMSKNLEEHGIIYGLHQAPRAWYETLSMYLLEYGFHKGKIDKTLFIRRHKDDILLVQVYVDDIIFGSTKKELCNSFEKMIYEKFQMSSMGELTFFLGLQVKQKQDGIFISHDKYVVEILKKYGFLEVKNASTPIETYKPWLKDEDGKEVDVHMYRLMIGSLLYLTSSRPYIMFSVCACARYQVNLKVSHHYVLKRIFRYLKGQPKFGLWYPKDSSFDLVAYTDSDYAGASLDRNSTTGGCQFLRSRLISWQCKKQTVIANSTSEAEYVAASSCCGQATAKVKNINGEAQLHVKVDGKKVVISEASIMRDLQFGDEGGVDCLPNKVIFEQLTLMSAKTTTWNEFSSTMASVVICLVTNQKFNFSKYTFESMMKNLDSMTKNLMYPRVYCDEAVNEEMDDKLVMAATTASSLESKKDSGNIAKTQSKATPNESSSEGTNSGGGARCQESMRDTIAKTRVLDLEATKTTQAQEIDSLKRRVKNLKKKQRLRTHKLKRLYKVGLSARVESSDDKGLEMFDADKDLQSEEVVVKQEDKGKAKKIKEPMKLKKKDQILFNEEVARKLQEEINEEERLLAERMKAEEQQELNEEEKAKLTELVEESSKKVKAEITQEKSSKRAGDELEQETAKKQKIVDDTKTTNLKQLVKIIHEEDIAIDVIPLAMKTLIVDWKI